MESAFHNHVALQSIAQPGIPAPVRQVAVGLDYVPTDATAEQPVVVEDPDAPDIVSSNPNYAKRFAGPVGGWMLSIQDRITKDLTSDMSADDSLLDVGGGHGQIVKALQDSPFGMTVLGSSPQCQAMISQQLEQHRCRFVQGRVMQLPFDDQSFESVISYRMLAHLHDWRAFIAELTRVAQCSVIVDYPVTKSFNAINRPLFRIKRAVEPFHTRRFTCFSQRDIDAAFADRGFVCTKIVPQFFWPMAMHRIMRIRSVSMSLERLAVAIGLTTRFGSPVIARYDRVDM